MTADAAGAHDLDGREPAIPLLRWARGYGGGELRRDLLAGATVAVMLIPQSMAYALLAGVPPIYGLYASIVPLLVYTVLGTSMQLAVGVVAIDMLIVHAGLAPLATEFSVRWIQLAVLLAAVAGTVQLLMGAMRLGFLVNLLSRPVVVGFTSGAAVLIALSQVGGLTGMDMERSQTLPGLVRGVPAALQGLSGPSLALGLGSVAALLLLRWWKKDFPSVLVVAVLATALVGLFGLDATIRVVGTVPTGLPSPVSPAFSVADVRLLAPSAVALAFVQFLTVISLGKILAGRHRQTVEPNRELVAIGAANLAGSFFRALPVSASFSRSSLNEQAGARTPASNAVAALTVGASLLFLTPVLALVPVPTLSAIIVVAALWLLDLEQMRFLWRAKSTDGGVALLTFATTILGGILAGIGIGVVASLAALLFRISRPNVAVLGHLAGTRSFRDLRFSPDARALEDILILRIDASFSFMNAEFLRDLILTRTKDPDDPVRVVLVDAHSVNDLDMTAADVLVQIKRAMDRRGIDLYFAGVKEPVEETLRRSGLYEELGRDRFFLSPHRAISHILTGWGMSESYLRDVPGAASPVEIVEEQREEVEKEG